MNGIKTVNTPIIGTKIVGHLSRSIQTSARAPAPWKSTWKALICLALVCVPITTTVSWAISRRQETAAEIMTVNWCVMNSDDFVEIDLPADTITNSSFRDS